MHLSKELQKQLKKIGSSIELAKTIDNESPSNYAFYKPKKERNFRIDFGETINEYSIVYFDRTEKRNHEICYLRGKFNLIERLAESIKMWIEDEETIDKIAIRFTELEKFEFDKHENPNPKIEERWIYVKNWIFNDTKYWKKKNWERRYFNLIEKAKKKKEWENYYPFQSHAWLRFSINDELTETWELGLHIIPTWTTENGEFHVGVPEREIKEGYTFKELDEAIDFYEKKLIEYQPIKWN